MSVCPNCGARITCGCQRKTASDGKQGCSQCIPAYEKKLSININSKSGNHLPPEGQIPDVTVTLSK